MPADINLLKDGGLSPLGQRLLDQFDQVYIINLPQRTDRKRGIQQQFARIGLDFDDPKVNLFKAMRPESRGKWPTIGAKGCFFSHLNVLQHATTADYQSILILEDDADWSDSFIKQGHAILDQMSQIEWDILHGGLEVGGNVPKLHPLPNELEVIQSHFVALKGQTIGKLAAYLTAMAAREAGDPRGGPMHVDGAYNWFRNQHPTAQSFIAVPCIAQQRPSRTDIHDLHWTDRLPVVRELKNYLRTVLHNIRRSRRSD